MDQTLFNKLTKDQEDAALEEVGYSRAQLKADVNHIKEWLKNQHHLPPSKLKEPDSFLESYLVGCKGSLEKVKRKLDFYYSVRSYSEIYDVRDPLAPEYLSIGAICDFIILPNAGVGGVQLVLGTFTDTESEKFDFLNYSRIISNRAEVNLRIAGFATKQYVMIDCRGASPSAVLKMKPSLVRDLIGILEDLVPMRTVKLALINAPSYMEVAVNNFVKPFLSKKIKERFSVTSEGTSEDLLNYFSPSILPRDYGGVNTNPSLKEYSEKWYANERVNRQWFLNELSERTEESKRIITDDTPTNPYFGIHGSLKKLVID